MLLEERRPQGTGQPGTHVIAVMLGTAQEWAWHPLPGTGSLLPAALRCLSAFSCLVSS